MGIMAKIWSGFLPQNEVVKAKWRLMEAQRPEMAGLLKLVRDRSEREASAQEEEEGCWSIQMHEPG